MQPPSDLPTALRSHLARHNWQVRGFSALTLLAAVALWVALYVMAYWLTIFGLTIFRAVSGPS